MDLISVALSVPFIDCKVGKGLKKKSRIVRANCIAQLPNVLYQHEWASLQCQNYHCPNDFFYFILKKQSTKKTPYITVLNLQYIIFIPFGRSHFYCFDWKYLLILWKKKKKIHILQIIGWFKSFVNIIFFLLVYFFKISI